MADRTLTHAASLVPIGAFAGKPAMPLSRPVVSVGSGKQNRIQLKSDTVSTTHALLVHTEAGWYVRDLGSRTHTILNGKVAREATLKNGDTLTIGAFVFHFVTDDRRDDAAVPAPAALEITDAELPVPLDTKTIVIGRRQGCEVRLLEESASLVHAIIFEADGAHYVRDLYSRTHTFLNGKKVHQERLRFGDEVVVGETHLKYVADAIVDEVTPVAAEVAAPIAVDEAEIPLSPTARDTIDADREEAVEADAPVLPLSRRDRFESLAPSEVPSIDVDAPIAVEPTPDELAEASDEIAEPLAPIDALAPTDEFAPTDELAPTDDFEPTAVRSDPLDASDVPAPTLDVRAAIADASVPLAQASTLDTPGPTADDAAPTLDARAPMADARAPIAESTDGPTLATTPDDDEADILGLAPPIGATHAVADDAIEALETPLPVGARAADDHADALAADLAPTADDEAVDEAAVAESLAPVEAPRAVDEPAAESVVAASEAIDDALAAPAEVAQTAPDDDEADILGLAPPAHASHAVAPIDDAALAPAIETNAAEASAAEPLAASHEESTRPVDVRPPDVIAVPHVAAERPAPPTEAVAVDAPEPVDDFAAAAGAIAIVEDEDALPAAAIRSPLEPTATEPLAPPSADDAPATPAEAAALVRLEARVRDAIEHPSSAAPLPPLVSGDAAADVGGEPADLATQLGEATRRARVIAEVLESTEGFEADAARQPIDFADAPPLADVPGHEATRVVDAGAGAIVASLDDERATADVASLEFGDVPLDASLPPLDLEDDAELPPLDETVAPLALDDIEIESEPGFARELGTPPGADEPVTATLGGGADALVPTSSPIVVVDEHAPATLSAEHADEPIAAATDDEVIDVVAVPVTAATIRDAMPPADVVAVPAEPIVDATPTSLGELQSAMPGAALAIDSDVRDVVDLPVAGDERAVEVSDFRAPIEADAYRAGDVIGTSPIVGTGPTPEESLAAQDAEARAIEEEELAADAELAVDQAALDVAGERIDAPHLAPSFAIAPEPHVEPIAAGALTSATVDPTGALDLPPATPLEHHARPLIAADEHLGEHAAPHADAEAIASIEPTPFAADESTTVAAATTIDAAALTASVAESLAPVADETSPGLVGAIEAVPSDAAPTILTETDDEIASAAGLNAHADVVTADAAASLAAEAGEPMALVEPIAPATVEDVVADLVTDAHFDVIHTADEPTEVVVVSREQPRNAALDDAFADALAMAAGHTFAPEVLPPQRPVDERLARQWKLDESLLEQADHAPQGPIDPLAAGIHPAGVEGFLNLGGIGYIGDETTDEYEPATNARLGPTRRARPRRQVTPPADPAATGPTNAPAAETTIAPVDPPLDAELETLADAPTSPQRRRPATPPRPVRRPPPAKRGQAAVEESFASSAPTTHSPFAEQALPLVDAFGGQNDAFSHQPAEGLDVMLARLGTGDVAGRVLDQPAIVADAPSALDTHARPIEGRARGPRPATPTPTPFASHVPIASPTPPRPRRPFTPRRTASKLPLLSMLLLLLGAAIAGTAWYWPVPRTLQGQLTFENLDKLNTVERTKVQDGIRATLATLAPAARKRLDDRYGDGFLDRPEAFRVVADGARFGGEDPNALVVRVTSTVNAVDEDRFRLAKLLTVALEAHQSMADARDKLIAELRELQKKQDAATAKRDATQRQLDIARPLAATLSSDLDALRTLDAEIAALDKARQAAAQTLVAREADLRRLEVEATAMGVGLAGDDAVVATSTWPSGAFANFAGQVLTAAPIARLVTARGVGGGVGGIAMLAGGGEVVAAVAADAPRPAGELDQLARDRDAAKLRLDQLLQSQSPAARQAREGFDQALGDFASDVEAANKALGDRPDVLAYVQSARALQKQNAQMTDEFVHRQEKQFTLMNGLKAKLADLNDSNREQLYAADEQVKTWTTRLAIAQRRLNAAKDANAPAQDVDDIQREVSLAESTIAARKEVLDDPKAKSVMLARDLESMIQNTQREMASDRQQNERMLASITDAFRRQEPAVAQLPDDQKKLAQQLAGRLAQIDLARRRYTNSLGLVAGGEAQAIADARAKFDALDQQLTQRRAQVDASATAQAAEMERRARVARSLDDARTALIAARAARDRAEAAYAARSSPRDALVRRIDVARHAGQQKEVLEAQLTATKKDAEERIKQLDALQNRVKFAVYPKGVVEPIELPTAGVDPRLAVGAGGIVVLLCILAPFILIELRRRGREMAAPDVLGDGHSTNFPSHATAA